MSLTNHILPNVVGSVFRQISQGGEGKNSQVKLFQSNQGIILIKLDQIIELIKSNQRMRLIKSDQDILS